MMAVSECRNAREFGEIFRNRIGQRGGASWSWRKDIRPWLSDMMRGVKFGDSGFDWSPAAARELADGFIEDARTW